MRKTTALIIGIVMFLILVVVVLGGGKDDCQPGSSSSGSDVVVDGDYAYPTDKSKVTLTSPFSERVNPVTGASEFHLGVDLAGPKGTPIYAFADGVVVAAQDSGVQGFGGWVVLDHNIDGEKIQTVYGHIEPGHVHVKTGDTVKKGQHIADMGTAGTSTGDHLHFEVVKGDRAAGGKQVDPEPWLEKAAEGKPSGHTDNKNTDGSGKEKKHASRTGQGDPGEVQGTLGLSGRQAAIAKQIVAVGEVKGMDEKAIVIALATAKHESQLQNLASDGSGAHASGGASPASKEEIAESLKYPHDGVGADNASVGTFQQQVGFWGTAEELMNPAHQAEQFYDRLKGIDYHSMTVGQAAHTIQVNNTGTAPYDAEAEIAQKLYDEFKGAGKQLSEEEIQALGINGSVSGGKTTCDPTRKGGRKALPNGPVAEKILAAAKEQFGLPYVWGGGNFEGPTGGGFDCSGLVLYSVAQATDGAVQLCHNTNCQMVDPAFETVSWEDRQPGDILYFGTPGGDYHHTSIYSGEKDGQAMQYEAQTFGVPLGAFPVRMGEDIQVRRVKHGSGAKVKDEAEKVVEGHATTDKDKIQ
ncbi:peptidoglycan DD-metalloendopeptidase family protein [Corynebacterium sp. 3HC-13]|uniref:peptidoglycan DD-metalloendopeptidase family protein n=1 Tax=Corynebacterium poyangense TaxID=2684405 RepID=UPI001CC9D86E|nr:peptidoglycan DD-metalloendopeptidase family protein [Corynebacterium poyangense]MBZ8176211.1 peptidoglycan DD-metalloendopeptidase family protein [Corynebacterium poyangense]